MIFNFGFTIIFTVYIIFNINNQVSCYTFKSLSSGCSSYNCKRSCSGSNISPTPGDNGFKVIVENLPEKRYKPNRDYKISIVGNKLKTSTVEFNGFLLVAVPESWYDAMPFTPIGKFKINSQDRDVRYASGCSEMVTHKNNEAKSKITVWWSAPPSGSGCVSFKAMVFQNDETVWFKDDGQLTLTLCEDENNNSPKEIRKCCACGEAKYSMNFKGLWSKVTHPKDWPENEYLTHWSNLIGAVHSRNFTMWEYGGLASEGLKELAIYGITKVMEEELKNHSKENYIRNIVAASGLWHPFVTNETNSWLSVSNTHHLFSLATMMGPSPDWLTGISKLDLCLANCTWVKSLTIDLFPFDAGVDSGISYNSPDRPTIPQEKIHRLTSSYPNNPKSPFYDPNGKPVQPVAKLILKQHLLRGAQCPNGFKSEINNDNSVDFMLNDLTDPITRDKVLNDQVKKKSSGKGGLKILDKVDPRCMTLDWTHWTECSTSCGNGIRKRSRQYKDIKVAMGICNELLEDSEICMGIAGECNTGDNTAFNIADMCLMVTSWSSWSPCSVTCGTGNTVRIRQYIKPELADKCDTKLTETKYCKPIENKHAKCKDENTMTMEEKRQICNLDKLPGPCKMLYNATRYYYDRVTKECQTFEYGGCRGNKNNFNTKEECIKMCDGVLDGPIVEIPKVDEQKIKNTKKLCMMAREEGTCFESIPRYYFDRTKLMCGPLDYSGCGGNENNFATLTECEATCHPLIDLIKEDTESMRGVNQHLTIPEKKKICMSPEQVGNCDESIPRFYYSVQMGKCLTFDYTGCDGNLNNFETIKECEMVCDVLIDMAKQALENEQKQDQELVKKEMCMEPMEVGPCTNYIEKYYFNTQMGKCQKFSFGGCNANDNNFDSMSECESTCSSLIDMNKKMEKVTKFDMESSELAMQERKKICELPVLQGSCASYLIRYYYNPFSKDCDSFVYTGCNGNMNNFITYNECKKKCVNITNNEKPKGRTAASRNQIKFEPINCVLTEWSEWSDCSANECGKKGKSTRSREIKVHAKFNGEECPKKLDETRICYKKCNNGSPIDCIVGQWGMWSECKTYYECEGYQERERPILRNSMYGGLECPKTMERRKCMIGKCNKGKKNLN